MKLFSLILAIIADVCFVTMNVVMFVNGWGWIAFLFSFIVLMVLDITYGIYKEWRDND